MSEPKESAEESQFIHYRFDEKLSAKITQIALDVLETHDGIAESYQGMNMAERTTTAMMINKSVDLHPLPDELLRQRIKLHFEIDHASVIGAHHFAKASAECIDTYRSGFFVACTMMSHSINEGIIEFVVKRNCIKRQDKEKLDKTIDILASHQLLSCDAANASKAIYRSYRNAIHHMREDITKIQDWHELAKKNLRNLARVESCVFGFDLEEGAMRLHFPKHWDPVGEDMVQIWMRFG